MSLQVTNVLSIHHSDYWNAHDLYQGLDDAVVQGDVSKVSVKLAESLTLRVFFQ
jgi:hypothetical protein